MQSYSLARNKAVGLGCGVLNLSNQTVNVTATNDTVTTVTCTVTNSAIKVNLPTISTTTLNGAGRGHFHHELPIGNYVGLLLPLRTFIGYPRMICLVNQMPKGDEK